MGFFLFFSFHFTFFKKQFPFYENVHIGDRESSRFGHDSTHYLSPVDLFSFITGYYEATIYVGSGGGDTDYTAMTNFPCSTVNQGVTWFKITRRKAIKVAESGAVDKSLALSLSSLTSSSNSLSVLSLTNSLSNRLTYAGSTSVTITVSDVRKMSLSERKGTAVEGKGMEVMFVS
jgi:hypothetical protein